MHFQFKKYFPLLLGFQSHMYLIKISVRMKWRMNAEMVWVMGAVPSVPTLGILMWDKSGERPTDVAAERELQSNMKLSHFLLD